jgi:2-methylisocitrate lyase-like PEP mutase family enzyme
MPSMNGYTNGDTHDVHSKCTPGGRLRKLLADKSKIIVAPGVYDGFSARIALEVGFECIYMVHMSLRFCSFSARVVEKREG